MNNTPYGRRRHAPGSTSDDVGVAAARWDFTQHSRSAHFVRPREAARTRHSTGTRRLRDARGECQTVRGQQQSWAFGIVPLLDDELGYYRPALYVLFGAVGLLFVIGCLNVASLLITRALGREREIAVRTALGAAPRQIVTQLLAESFLLSLAGAAAGLVVALVALPVIAATMPVEVPRLAEATVNARVLGVALGLVR